MPGIDTLLRKLAEQDPALLGWRCVPATLDAETEHFEEAAIELEWLARHPDSAVELNDQLDTPARSRRSLAP